MENKYNDEKIENDIKIYVKIDSNKSIENELKNYIAQFDLNDKKILWDGDINCEFSLDCIIIDLKKTNTYPEFKLEYLGINETIKFEYISGPKPAEYLFDEQYKFFGKSYPSLTTINTIRSTLKTFIALV